MTIYRHCSCCVARQTASRFWNIVYSHLVGPLGRGIGSSQSLYLHKKNKHGKERRNTSILRVRFEPTIPKFERYKLTPRGHCDHHNVYLHVIMNDSVDKRNIIVISVTITEICVTEISYLEYGFFLVIFISPFRKIPRQYLKIAPTASLPKLLPIRHSLSSRLSHGRSNCHPQSPIYLENPEDHKADNSGILSLFLVIQVSISRGESSTCGCCATEMAAGRKQDVVSLLV
jgi:hypothetical protein